MFKKPPVVAPGEDVTCLGRVFGTPVVVKGISWLPLTQAALWGLMAWVAGRRQPGRSWRQRFAISALTMPVVLGSEWCHNLMHAAAARLVDKPMDALRITWGMPLVVYYDVNDTMVMPRQHVARALGGPLSNMVLLAASLFLRRRTRPDSVGRDVADAARARNLFLATVAFFPHPMLDGGPILKWSLVERGCTIAEADAAVRQVNVALGTALITSGPGLLKRRRWLWGIGTLLFGLSALVFGLGIVREQ